MNKHFHKLIKLTISNKHFACLLKAITKIVNTQTSPVYTFQKIVNLIFNRTYTFKVKHFLNLKALLLCWQQCLVPQSLRNNVSNILNTTELICQLFNQSIIIN